ncbi:hypothetical protein JCM5353_003433 [Sporobolomyces roseus]
MSHTAPSADLARSRLASERPPTEDDSSLTSLSDLEEVSTGQGAISRGRNETRARIEQATAGRTIDVVVPRKKGKPKADGRRKRTPQASNDNEKNQRSVFAAPPTPNLNSLLTRRDREFELATRQATAGRRRKSADWRAADDDVPDAQVGLALMSPFAAGRLASFCTAVDIPIFPISPLKLSLFLSQALEIVLFDITSQPLRFPLPTVNPNDRSNLTPDEGTRLTRELAEAWIQALGFAQLATARTWEKMALSPASLVPLSEDGTIREILAAIPSIQDWTRYEAMVDLPLKAREKPSSKTRWVRGGKPVEGPMQAVLPPARDFTAPTSTANETSSIDYAYAFQMPIPRPSTQAPQ